MINCQNIIFSRTLSDERIEKASNLFGEKVVNLLEPYLNSLIQYGLPYTFQKANGI